MTTTITVVEFLRARLDEHQAMAEMSGWAIEGYVDPDAAWVLRDVAAKRRIVEEFSHAQEVAGSAPLETLLLDPGPSSSRLRGLWFVLCTFASMYADHPDYDPRWTQ